MKVLIVRLSSIGDIVLCSPVVRVLYKAGHEVHFLSKKSYVHLLEPSPYISKVLAFDENWGSLIREVKNEGYDVLIDLHKNLRTLRLKLFSGVKSYSFPKINLQKWMKVKFKRTKLPDVHIVDRYIKPIEVLGLNNDNEGLDYFFPEDFEFDWRSWLSQRGIEDNYIAWVTGGTHSTKRLPEEKIVDFAEKSSVNIVLIGGPEEMEMGDRISKKFDHVLNAAGYTSIPQSSALILHSQLVISNDTGMMHIAAALKKKIISLWGNTIPEFGMSPNLPQHPQNHIAIEIKNLNCRPCSKIGYNKCPKGHFNCMNTIKTEDIIEAQHKL